MLGQRNLFQSLFPEQNNTTTVILTERKSGRSEVLNARKNELVVCRYYYYARHHDLNYEKTLEKLEAEIFLAQRTLINILNENSALLRQLRDTSADLKYFRNKYPHWVWKEKAA